MKTAILCISDVYLGRARMVRRLYEKLGDETVILTPDFSHRLKRPISAPSDKADDPNPPVEYLPHRPYRRNLSFDRLKGHWDFAKACRLRLEEIRPDRIHCLIPANSLARQMAIYKKEHPNVQLIFDLNDLWPESLPAKGLQNTFLFWPWKRLRTASLPKADLVISECGLFASVLEQSGCPSSIVYWPGALPKAEVRLDWDEEHFDLAYLGSINNIIDIPLICSLMEAIGRQKPVRLHLVGAGEKKAELIEKAESAGAQVLDYGAVYDPLRKQEIFRQCRLGLNLMKPEVVIGLSLKSIDYLSYGLPFFNNLSGDSRLMTEKDGAGISCSSASVKAAAQRALAMSRQENEAMRASASRLYNEKYTPRAFENQLVQALAGAGLLSEKERANVRKELE